jgi:hypothetical protein
MRVEINIDNYDGADSDAEIGPFFEPKVQHQLPTTEQEMILLLSNSQLKEELRK